VTFLVFVVVLRLVRVRATARTTSRAATRRAAQPHVHRLHLSQRRLHRRGIAVMSELLPPFAKNTAHVSEPAIGVLWFVFSASSPSHSSGREARGGHGACAASR
jgi:hypothetical protein